MTRPRAADDFAVIHARLEELRREHDQVSARRMPGHSARRRLLPSRLANRNLPHRALSLPQPHGTSETDRREVDGALAFST
jgi:hypothetical protein